MARGFSREQINFGHPRNGGRKGGAAYARPATNPHKHVLPRGMKFSSPANDRLCVPHTTGAVVKCDVEECDRKMGLECHDCGRVV